MSGTDDIKKDAARRVAEALAKSAVDSAKQTVSAAADGLLSRAEAALADGEARVASDRENVDLPDAMTEPDPFEEAPTEQTAAPKMTDEEAQALAHARLAAAREQLAALKAGAVDPAEAALARAAELRAAAAAAEHETEINEHAPAVEVAAPAGPADPSWLEPEDPIERAERVLREAALARGADPDAPEFRPGYVPPELVLPEEEGDFIARAEDALRRAAEARGVTYEEFDAMALPPDDPLEAARKALELARNARLSRTSVGPPPTRIATPGSIPPNDPFTAAERALSRAAEARAKLGKSPQAILREHAAKKQLAELKATRAPTDPPDDTDGTDSDGAAGTKKRSL